MASASIADKVSYQEFHEEWIAEVEDGEPSPLDKGRRFASNLITQWLDVTTDDDDFVICDGSGDGGIDVAYLKRADIDTERHDDNSEQGDTWYLVQSKYGTAFAGVDTILEEGSKVIATLMGQNQHLSQVSRQLLQKLDLFRQQASEADRIVLVFATTNPITQQDRQALDDIKLIGRERGIRNFDVEEVSLQTIWEALEPDEAQRLSIPVKGQFVEQYSGLLVGTVSLVDLFEFLKSYKSKTGDLTTLYEKNVRQFLGGRRKINRGIANTLNESPEKFGLYNNGITVVVSGYSKSLTEPDMITMNDPHVVNGCQTTRTIWDVLDSKLNSGGTGSDAASAAWRERVSRGGVVTKIVRSDEAEITNITRFTNSQNSVREQDFIALHSGFQNWATAMASGYDIFLEIQRGGAQARRAYETQHPDQHQYSAFANAFELIKVYGAGWIGAPGLAFGKNAPFLPQGSIYERIVSPSQDVADPFGARDLYAAYKIKCAADSIGFGRNTDRASRRQSRFLFYYIIMRMLSNVILLTPQFRHPPVSGSVLTDAVLRLTAAGAEDHFNMLCNAAIALLDQYLTVGSDNSAHNETAFMEKHNGDLNGFLKAEDLGKECHSPLLVQLLAQHNQAFASIPMPMYDGNPTQREFVARALIEG